MGEPGKGSPALQASNYSAPQLSTPPHTRQALGSLSSCLYATRNRGDLGSFHTFFYTFLSAVSHSEASDLLAVTARCRVQGSPGPCFTSVPNVREPSTQQSHNFTWVNTDRVFPAQQHHAKRQTAMHKDRKGRVAKGSGAMFGGP